MPELESARESESDRWVQEHPKSDTFHVVSQPGRAVEIWSNGRRVLSLDVRDANPPWLPGAVERAVRHAQEPVNE